MLSRLAVYFKERYPILPRLLLGGIVFLEIHFIILLNYGVTDFKLGIQELVGIYTVFAFLMWLRIADDLKDFETDMQLFPDRPLPSGRVLKKDVMIVCFVVELAAVALNAVFMNNFLFFLILYGYGYLMSKWFFHKKQIQPSLPLALVTHNPVQMFVNVYIISFTVIKYDLPPVSLFTVMALWTLYFPALIWEVSRKIRAPKDETEYTTYSKLFGYQKSTRFVMILTLVDIVTNMILVYNLNRITILIFIALVSWMVWKFLSFIRDPDQFVLVEKVELYTYIQESLMLLTIVGYLAVGRL